MKGEWTMDERDEIRGTVPPAEEAKGGFSWQKVLSGGWLAGKLQRHRLLVCAVVVGMFFYIYNRYLMEELHRERTALEKEVQELRFESIATAADLMFVRKQSEVLKRIRQEGLSLEESKEPPMKLYR